MFWNSIIYYLYRLQQEKRREGYIYLHVACSEWKTKYINKYIQCKLFVIHIYHVLILVLSVQYSCEDIHLLKLCSLMLPKTNWTKKTRSQIDSLLLSLTTDHPILTTINRFISFQVELSLLLLPTILKLSNIYH